MKFLFIEFGLCIKRLIELWTFVLTSHNWSKGECLIFESVCIICYVILTLFLSLPLVRMRKKARDHQFQNGGKRTLYVRIQRDLTKDYECNKPKTRS